MADKIRVVVSSVEPEKGPIKLRISVPPPPTPGVKIKVEPKDVSIKLQIKEPIKVYLKVRSTLNGNYIIYDHPLYDIVIMPSKNKIMTFLNTLKAIYDFLKEEVPDITNAIEFEDTVEDHYTNPDEEDTTELGKVPQATKKGTIDPHHKPYGLIYRI